MSCRNYRRYRIKVADADLVLMPGRSIAFPFGGELGLLQLGIGRHPALAVVAGQFEHREIEAVKAGQGDELEPIAHSRDVALKAGEPLSRQLFAPVETGGAIVGQRFVGELAMDRVGKALGLAEVGLARLPPQEIGIRGIGQAARNRVFDAEPRADTEEAFGSALAADERAVTLIDVA